MTFSIEKNYINYAPKISGQQDYEKFTPKHLQGRYLFGEKYEFFTISRFYEAGYIIKSIKLTQDLNFESIKKIYGKSFIPLFVISYEKNLKIFTVDYEEIPKPGQTMVTLLYEP